MTFKAIRFSLLLALGAVAAAASAQETNNLSKPAGDVTDKVDSINDGSQSHLNAGSYNAPRQFFNNYTPSLPAPQPLYLGNQDAAAREAAEKRKNWALLTPEQIYDIQTPEQIMGIKDPDSGSKLSLEEQYLLRESQPLGAGHTNGGAAVPSWRDVPNPFDKSKDDKALFSRGSITQPAGQSRQDSSSYFNQFLNANKGGGFFNKKETQAADWNSVFAQPAQPKPDVEQLADMERFRALMNPVAPSEKSQSLQTAPTSFSTTPTPAVDSLFKPQPIFNPAGRPIASIQDDISRPLGIKPLSGITGSEVAPPETRPAWQAQLPPWLSDGPQGQNAKVKF